MPALPLGAKGTLAISSAVEESVPQANFAGYADSNTFSGRASNWDIRAK
jgi:hypothetical protein